MKHKFVEFIPSKIEEGILYISIEYDIAMHKCPCGCGDVITTTLSPARWKLTYDGETVSLHPSIGNWSHACQSHYFITKDKVVWAGAITKDEVDKVVKNDKESLKRHIESGSKATSFINRIKSIFKSR
jgi:hypothetical protein